MISQKWEPITGGLYKTVSELYLNQEPKVFYFQREGTVQIKKNEVFQFLGASQRIPGLYSFYHILYIDKALWLIYPERAYEQKHQIINPIPLT
jgi:hypothetical protein